MLIITGCATAKKAAVIEEKPYLEITRPQRQTLPADTDKDTLLIYYEFMLERYEAYCDAMEEYYGTN